MHLKLCFLLQELSRVPAQLQDDTDDRVGAHDDQNLMPSLASPTTDREQQQQLQVLPDYDEANRTTTYHQTTTKFKLQTDKTKGAY